MAPGKDDWETMTGTTMVKKQDPLYSIFNSTDIRERENQERMSSTTLVAMLTRYCLQKPGGLFKLPKIASSDYCVLCDHGNTCLGHSCKGKKEPSDNRAVTNYSNQEASCPIPGLQTLTETDKSSSVLKKPTFTFLMKSKISALSPQSAIFKPRTTIQSSSSSSAPDQFISSDAPHSKTRSAIIRTPLSYLESSKLQKKLKNILKSSKQTKMRAKQVKIVQEDSLTSLFRKLAISEIPCPKLSSSKLSCSKLSSPTSSNSLLPSSSHKSHLHSSSHQLSEQVSSEYYYFSPNYSQIIHHLRTEWEAAKSSEIFNIENSEVNVEMLPEPEVMRMDSSPGLKKDAEDVGLVMDTSSSIDEDLERIGNTIHLNASPDMFMEEEDDSSYQALPIMSDSPAVSLSTGEQPLLPPASPSPTDIFPSNEPSSLPLSESTSPGDSLEGSFDWSGEEYDFYTINNSFELLPQSTATNSNFKEVLTRSKTELGIPGVVRTILEDEELKDELMSAILGNAHQELKGSLRKSQLSKDKKKSDRKYLLSIGPQSICQEFAANAPAAYQLLVQGLIGVNSELDSIHEKTHLRNNIALLYSTISKLINRKASGYSLLQTAIARDGGLREDSIKLFPNLSHPRTMQRYDAEVLAKNWDESLRLALAEELRAFENLREAEKALIKAVQEGNIDVIDEAEKLLNQLKDDVPHQVELVWDNINLRTKHKHQRVGDNYSENNLDWMASLWIKERADLNHMKHQPGCAVKQASDLSIADFVPTQKEKDYVFIGLVRYFAFRLLHRHPKVFKSINSSVKVNHPHQFEEAMCRKSEEYTGELFTKSESRTEDLLSMMEQVQEEFVHKYIDENGKKTSFEKRVISGDQKTEKNSYYGILSKLDEKTEEAGLCFLQPTHEYFHQYMVLADVENELFREKSRGLEGGSFFLATLLNRKDALLKKGKDAVDGLEEYFLLKADARFCHYFLNKFGLDPSIDNTPPLLKKYPSEKKAEYLHNKVAEVLRELLPFFSDAQDVDPELKDFPVQGGRRNKVADKEQTSDLESPQLIDEEMVQATASQVQIPADKVDLVTSYLEELSIGYSSSRSRLEFSCKLCSFKSKFKIVCISHIEKCLVNHVDAGEGSIDVDIDSQTGHVNVSDQEDGGNGEEKSDMYFNYKNNEFMIDAIFALSTIYEDYGDGLGMFIISKMMLPIFHGLHHSNYSCSIHRFITRVLCEATPKEALKLVQERFFNRTGGSGCNINKDRRMEHRIGILKRLISNLGPNFDHQHVQLVNKIVEIKELLYHQARKSHGVRIRSGRHVPRSDVQDYEVVFKSLDETDAHIVKPGRKFGDFKLHKDLMSDERFDRAGFYRWLTGKNAEARSVIEAYRRRKYDTVTD